jgi:hypothetical protein
MLKAVVQFRWPPWGGKRLGELESERASDLSKEPAKTGKKLLG